MKKVVSVILMLSMVTVLWGCSKNETEDTVSESTTSVSQVEEVETVSDSVVEEVSEDDTEGIYPMNGAFEFESTTINGDEIKSNYEDYELTVINVMATWCPPCVAELPDLGRVANDVKSKGVNIIGFVTDCRDLENGGQISDEAVDAALALQKDSGVSYPLIIPNETFLNGLLFTEYVPTTYFVNKNGDHVGGYIVSAQDYDTWIQTIDERLAML